MAPSHCSSKNEWFMRVVQWTAVPERERAGCVGESDGRKMVGSRS